MVVRNNNVFVGGQTTISRKPLTLPDNPPGETPKIEGKRPVVNTW